jgi:cycloartenol synthase
VAHCTAEGLRAVLAIRALFRERGKEALLEPPINDERIFDAVNVILSFQNPSGGWATYENTRSYPWLEYLNPSEVFSDIMIVSIVISARGPGPSVPGIMGGPSPTAPPKVFAPC